MAEQAAAPEGAATGGDETFASIKAEFAKALQADDGEGEAEAEPAAPAPKKGEKKPEAKTESEPEKKPDDDDEPEPTKADHARFRAERRKLKQREAELNQREEEQKRLHQSERALWHAVHDARRNGKPIEVLRILGLDPEDVAKQLAESALGGDPAATAAARRVAELEARLEREAEERRQQESSARMQRQIQAWEGEVAEALKTADDPILQAISEEPELIAQVREIQQEWFAEGDEDQRNPKAMRRAAKELAKKLESAKSRLGRIFREKIEDAASASDADTSSAAGRALPPRQQDKRSTRTMPASRGVAAPREQEPAFDTGTEAGRQAWKRHYAKMLANSDD